MEKKFDLFQWKAHLIVLCVFALFFTLYLSPVVFGGLLIGPEDVRTQNLPEFLAKRSLWSPLLCSGWPLLADPHDQICYLVSYICRQIPLPVGWNIFVIMGYVLCAFFMYVFVHQLTQSRFAGLVSGFLFAMSGFLMFEMRHPHIVHCTFYLLLALTVIERLAARPSPLWYALGALTVATGMLNGHPQTLSYCLVVLGCYAIVRAMTVEGQRLRFFLLCLSFMLVGLMIAAVQIIPTLELIRFSARAKFTFEDFISFSLNPVQGFGIFLPYLFGSQWMSYFGMPYFGLRASTQGTALCYLGMLPLILVPISTVLTVRAKAPLKLQLIFWLSVGFLAFLLSFGNATPLSHVLFHIPPFGSMRGHYRLYDIVAISTSVVSGLTLAALEKNRHLASTKTIAKLVICLAALYATILFLACQVLTLLSKEIARAGAQAFTQNAWLNPALNFPAIFFLGSVVLFFVWLGKTSSVPRQALLLAVCLLDLSFAGWFWDWRSEHLRATDADPPETVAIINKMLAQTHQRILPVRGGNASFDELPVNLTRLWNVASAAGYEPLIFTRYSALLDMTEGGFLMVPWSFKPEDRGFDLLAIKYLTTERSDDRLSKYERNGSAIFHKVLEHGSAAIFENTSALPRCWLAHQTIELGEQDILRSIKSGKLPDGRTFDPLNMALVESASNKSYEPDPSSSTVIDRLNNESVEVIVRSATPSYLVLSDAFYPGWKVSIDQKPAQLIRTDYVIRGMEVPGGQHRVTFAYQPISFEVGLSISIVSFILLLFGTLIAEKRLASKQQPV